MKRISVLLGLTILASCGQSLTELSSAPTTESQLGIITACSTRSQAEKLAQSHGLQFRVINEKRQLIEYVGISQSELIKLIPNSKFISNKIYDSPLIEKSSDSDINISSVENVPFYGAHTPVYRNSNAQLSFPHLSQIGALNLGSFQGEGVTIAIIDTGVYYNHPHLSPNIKTNTSEQSADGIDSDQNGLKDDYVGWDFFNGDAYPIDDNGHGTHVAGLAAGTFGGVAPKAKILPIKVLGADGSGDLATIAQGILYAIDQGADIINLSLGGSVPTLTSDLQNLINSVQFAQTNNSLIIAASGNGGSDGVGDCNDGSPIYPANINSNNVLSVASVNLYDQLTNYSNYGQSTVDIAAPGGDVSTGPLLATSIPNCNGACTTTDTTYVGNIGTSMATPIVSGVAALVKSKYPSYTYAQIKQIIEQSVEYHSNLDGRIRLSGVVNAATALSR